MTDESETSRSPPAWPDCEPGTTRVMVLGTYHMANPGHDVVNVEADDVLAPERQAELAALVDALADWSPDRVAVELDRDRQAAVADAYESYRSGVRSFDEESSFPDPLPDAFARSESVQIGFRLADRLDQDPPLAVDHDHRAPAGTSEEAMDEAMRGFPDAKDVAYPLPDPDEMWAADDERLRESTLTGYHRWINAPDQLRQNHSLMFAGGFEHDDADAAVGMLTAWYERNVRSVRTLWRERDPGDDRILLLYGSGHVRIFRHLLDEAPMFCPVSPLPFL